ncbi:MAG: alkaline phosphatase [Oleiphilaceae bacterium]|nr:alkaline phosphatase [Oleiphilaceae bacterium]
MGRLLLITFLLNGLFLALVLPAYPDLPWIAAEALLLSGIFAVLRPPILRSGLAGATGILYALLVFFTLCDFLVRESLGRSLNIYLEAGKISAAFNLLETNLGPILSIAGLIILLLALGALAVVVARLLNRIDRGSPSRGQRRAMMALGLLAAILTQAQWLPVAWTGSAQIAQQALLAIDTHRTTQAFRTHLEAENQNSGARALPALGDADVILGFVESYGVSAILDPRYRDLIGRRLDLMETALTDAGLHLVSGKLRSPVQGGQSWLAHATLLSGQWITTQLDYETLLASDYPTLIDDLRLTGHDTIAVMPAITRAWPEGRQLGYDRIYDSSSMDYEGPPLNWVTMPDQYTWSWFARTIQAQSDRPLFAEIALISSHAPWVPILPVLDAWETIGDGRVFEPWRDSGEAPASLWQDTDRVRKHYTRAIDYALAVITGYASRHVDNNTLLMIVGDHQPAPLITGDNASREVMVHLISADPDLLTPFIDDRGKLDSAPSGLSGFQPGTRPMPNVEGEPMDRFRPFLQRHFH